ncbi:MAG: hypothetical protein RBU37_24970 [Myxococcota bacterium]|jgi:hypothetical protein|nr:hypothetical protein [Myxococcota bacterium]
MAAIDDIQTHLEFLGYAIVTEGERKVATHESKLNFLIRELGPAYILTVFFRTQDHVKAEPQVLYGVVNKLNQDSVAARFLVDGDGDLMIEAFWPNHYDRTAFAHFIEAWHHDTALLAELREQIEGFLA